MFSGKDIQNIMNGIDTDGNGNVNYTGNWNKTLCNFTYKIKRIFGRHY